jgi:hypothetical protein
MVIEIIYLSERGWLRFRIIRLLLIGLMIPLQVQKPITSNLQSLPVMIPIMNIVDIPSQWPMSRKRHIDFFLECTES